MCSLNSAENLVEWAGRKIGEFYVSNPFLLEFFMKILNDTNFKRKDKVILYFLEVLESGYVKVPTLISKESYEEAMKAMDSLGKKLYEEEAKARAHDKNWLETAFLGALIVLRVAKEDCEKTVSLMGGLLRMFRLEEEKNKKP